MAKVTLTVEYRNKPSKQITCWPEEAVQHLRELAFKVAATKQYVAVYLTKAEVLQFVEEMNDDNSTES